MAARSRPPGRGHRGGSGHEETKGDTAATAAAPALSAEDKKLLLAQDEVSKSFKEGFIQKSDPKGKNWKRRYILVDEARQTLTYFSTDPRRTLAEYHMTEVAKGVISLKGAKVDILADAPRGAPSKHIFQMQTAERTSLFCCKNAEQLQSWMVFIQKAVQSNPIKVAKRRWALLARERAKAKASLTCKAEAQEGWILKTDPTGMSWTQRWLVLDTATRTLSYYDNKEKEGKPKGVVNLRSATVEIGSPNQALRNIPAFRVLALGRTYQLCARNQPELRLWINNIAATCREAEAASASSLDSAAMNKKYAGFLKKSNPKGKYWKKRWVVLEPADGSMTYFTDESKKKEKGSFSLRGATVEFGAGGVKAPTMYSMMIHARVPETRTWYMCAEDMESLTPWIDRIGFVLRKVAPKARPTMSKAAFKKVALRSAAHKHRMSLKPGGLDTLKAQLAKLSLEEEEEAAGGGGGGLGSLAEGEGGEDDDDDDGDGDDEHAGAGAGAGAGAAT